MKRTLTYILLASVFAVATATSLADVSPTPTPSASPATQLVDSKAKLEGALADFVTSLMATAGQAKDFIIKQAPDFVKQLLAWEFYSNLVWAGVFGIASALFGWWAFRSNPNRSDNDNDDWFNTAGLTIFTMVAVLCTLGFLMDAAKVYIAPQVYLVEYAKSLME